MNSNILEAIIARTRIALEERKRIVPISELERRASAVPARPSLAQSLSRPGVRVIAELKSASPSRGVIRADFQVEELALELEENGAAGLSVLTEEHYFHGSPEYLHRVAGRVKLPLLRKDFIVEPYQILEAKYLGASAVLLIAAALEDAQLESLARLAGEIGLEVLCEAHSAAELDRLLALSSSVSIPMIGVNARNLQDFSESLENSAALIERIPKEKIAVAESAISSAAEIAVLRRAGARGFLIGETLMRSARPGETLRKLCGNGK